MGHGHVTPNPDGTKARCGGPALCGQCAQEAATAAFNVVAGTPQPGQVTCPSCGHAFTPPPSEPPIRVTEANKSGDGTMPYGDVAYADPGYQADGKKRYPLDTEEHVRAAWSYVNQSKNAAKYSADQLAKVKAKIRAAMRKHGIKVSEAVEVMAEAMVGGAMSFDDIAEAVRAALRKRL